MPKQERNQEISTYISICFKESAHTTVGSGESDICTARRKRRQASTRCCSLEAEFLLLREPAVLLLRPLADWMKPTHTMEGHFRYSQPMDCGCSSRQSAGLTATLPRASDGRTGRYSLAKSTHTPDISEPIALCLAVSLFPAGM